MVSEKIQSELTPDIFSVDHLVAIGCVNALLDILLQLSEERVRLGSALFHDRIIPQLHFIALAVIAYVLLAPAPFGLTLQLARRMVGR